MKILMPQPMIIPAFRGIFPITEEDVKKYLVKIPRQTIEIVFFGSDSWSIHVLRALEDNFDIKAVICAPDSPVANYFRGPVLTPNKLNDLITYHLSLITCDLFIVASYGKIIPQELLSIPKFGALNVHPSLLPKYRGPSPVPATILNGDTKTGVTIIKLDEKMDHGPIVSTRKVRLSGREDLPTLINLLFQLGAEILVDIIPDFIRGGVKLELQDHAQAVYCPLLTKQSGYFNINNPPSAEKLDRMIRAYYPWPGVWTLWSPSRHPEAKPKDLKIIKFLPENLIQMEGKKPTPWKVFLNNYPDFPIKSITIDKQ